MSRLGSESDSRLGSESDSRLGSESESRLGSRTKMDSATRRESISNTNSHLSKLSIKYATNESQSSWGYSIFSGDKKISKIENTTIIDPYVRLIDTLKEAKTIYTRWGDFSTIWLL